MKNLKKTLMLIVIAGISFHAKSQIYINVPINQPPVLVADAGTDAAIASGNSIQIGGSPAATGGTAAYTYSWSPATGLSNTTIANPVASPSTLTIYTLAVTDANGCNDISTVTIDITTGINEKNLDIAVNIYPNPNDGNFTLVINGNNETVLDIEIVNTSGQIVFNEKLNKINKKFERQLNVSGYSKGIYTIKIKGNDMNIVKTFIIN